MARFGIHRYERVDGSTVGHRTARLIERRLGLPLSITAGLWPGLLGGLAAVGVLFVSALFQGIEPTQHLRHLAGLFLGPRAMLPTAAPVWLSILFLALAGILVSVPYTLVTRLTTRGRAVGLGLWYGALLWLLLQQLLLPLFAPGVAAGLTPWAFLASLFAYGLVLGSTFPAIERASSRLFVPLRHRTA